MKTFKSFIFIIFFFSLSNTFVFASIPNLHVGYLNKNTNTLTYSSLSNTLFSKPESVLVLNSFDPNYNTNGQTPLNSILSSSALLALDAATLKASSGVFGISSVSDVYRGGGVVDNSKIGVQWYGGNAQGMPFENWIGKILPEGSKLPTNFKTFDYYVPDTQTAISVKTLNTITPAKVVNPSQIYTSAKSNIDSIIDFTKHELSGIPLTNADILNRELHIGIPKGTSQAGMEQLRKAVDYGNLNGVKVIITEIK
ncbi:MAG: hypothetical protein LBD84_00980 [Campylobacteraceae bacterium]|nr:hypothetical protein [Campylobacteraceae bacterium]